MAWSVKVTEEYAAWFSALIKEDLASAVQVAQAVAALREEGPALGRPLVDRIQRQQDPSPQGTAARLGRPVRDQGALRVRSHPLSVAAARRDKAGNWQRWYRQKIPIAEQLYLEYTIEQEE